MSVTVGGSVGWIPLGPREIFRPHYRASGVYLSRVNVSNSLLDREEYDRMRRLTPRDHDFVNRGAVSVIPATTFTSAGNVHRNLLPIGPRDLRPLDTLERFRPDRSAVIGGARVISPPSRVIDREVVVQRRPSPFVPRPGLPVESSAPRDVAVGGAVRVIEPNSSRRIIVGDARDGVRDEHRADPPMRDDSRNDARNESRDNRRLDRWGRDNGIENRTEQRDDTNQPRREWRSNPPQDRREVRDPAHVQPQVNLPQQNPPPQPERHRVGPWVRDEQQLRPAPVQPQREQLSPPAPRPNPPKADPPRPTTPPPSASPQDNPPVNNQGGDRGRRPSERREIR